VNTSTATGSFASLLALPPVLLAGPPAVGGGLFFVPPLTEKDLPSPPPDSAAVSLLSSRRSVFFSRFLQAGVLFSSSFSSPRHYVDATAAPPGQRTIFFPP